MVGTPLALESALSKVRGKIAAEMQGKVDYTVLDGGFDFEYAVFDEVHSLDGEEGDALQRLVRAMACPMLALSATIGNAKELQAWWQEVRTAQPDVLPVTEVATRPMLKTIEEYVAPALLLLLLLLRPHAAAATAAATTATTNQLTDRVINLQGTSASSSSSTAAASSTSNGSSGRAQSLSRCTRARP